MTPISRVGLFNAAIFLLAASGFAQLPPPQPAKAFSHTGQFFVYGPATVTPLTPPAGIPPYTNLIRLDPSVAAVSCENIKHALLMRLDLTDDWQSRIYVTMHPARRPGEEITVSAIFTARGWNYHLETPNQVEPRRFIRGLVPLLLVELANRQPGPHTADVPLWLSDGLSRLVSRSDGLVVGVPEAPSMPGDRLPVTRTSLTAVKFDPFAQTRARLRQKPALRFDELSWPSPTELAGDQGEFFRECAELFVHELLQLQGGPHCLQRTLALMTSKPDWREAFHEAWQPHFKRASDVEKWWKITQVHFLEREPGETWPPAESLTRLDHVLTVPVEVRVSTNDLPIRGETSLQRIIREWKPAQQQAMLRRKCNQLSVLRPRMSPQLLTLLDDYLTTIRAYLTVLDALVQSPDPAAQQHPVYRAALKDALKRLDLMDVLREDMRLYGRNIARNADGS